MKKILVVILIVLCVVFVGILFLKPVTKTVTVGNVSNPADFRSATFYINNTQVTLVNGVAQVDIDNNKGKLYKSTIKYFGNELTTDIDGDGLDDVVFLITQQTGGTGTFYYAVGALKRGEGYIGTKASFIGDRIAPQNIVKGEGRTVVVNYADRAPGEPFTTKPSIGKSETLIFDAENMRFGKIVEAPSIKK